MILVDTSVWIDFFNGHASAESDLLTLCLAERRPIVLPGIVLTEILLGVRDDTQAAQVSGMLLSVSLTPECTRSDYEDAATLYRACRSRGFTVRSTVDCLIAQLCLRQGYELLSRDRDFELIARVFPLRRAVPGSDVQERAAQYLSSGHNALPVPAAPHRSSRSAGPALSSRAARGAPRSSRASAPRLRAIRR